MIFNMVNFLSNFLAKNECLEHFIAGLNQCSSRISLYRFYWACHFRSARDLFWHELLTWNVAMLQKLHEKATVFCCYRML